ncbi:hypothetical protein AZ019_001156 [Klebsiella pneumoniae]|uniref:hypothetical protein n=1 Tax=Klebsiella pneumoniae TaxID=573 RepID=UPI000A3B8781|nr:hypothetical protein [Klebsiella pneumoniae]OUH40261.1 hypothetical protein AZ019_001156 [Klebsiella pneumoniae]
MNISTVNELIASLESAGELSIREQKFLKLAKAFKQLAAENVALRNSSSHVLQSGEPPKTYREEWFIARVKGRGFAVLRSLPEEYSYDYTTLDATYFRKDLILEWMQLPNSEFLPNVKTPATDAYLAGIKADGVEDEPFGFVSRNGDVVVIELNGDRHIRDGMPVFVKEMREGADK